MTQIRLFCRKVAVLEVLGEQGATLGTYIAVEKLLGGGHGFETDGLASEGRSKGKHMKGFPLQIVNHCVSRTSQTTGMASSQEGRKKLYGIVARES